MEPLSEILKQIGFYEKNKDGWFYYPNERFEVIFNTNEKEPYFFIETFMSGDRDSAPYPFINIERLKDLIEAHIKYFK